MFSVTLRLSGEATARGGTIRTLTLEDGDTFVIGRDAACDWSLDDPRNRISRKHCALRRRGDTVLLVDHSSNGTALNVPGNQLVPDQQTELPDTAKLFLGGSHATIDYECERASARQDVDDDDIFGIGAHRKTRRAGPELAALPSLDLLDDDDPDRDNPLAKAMGEADARRFDSLDLDDTSQEGRAAFVPEARAEDAHTFRTPKAASPEVDLFALDDDEDPFGDLTGRPAPGGRPAEAPDDLDLGEVPDAPDARPGGGGVDDLGLDDDPPARASVAPEPEPAPQAAPAPAPPPVQAPAPQSAAATRAQDEEERVLDALFIALGLSIEDVAPEDRKAFVIEVGRTFRTMADGLRELLMQRQDAKLALTHTGGTRMEYGANPLKFARSADAAVKGLLRPETPNLMKGTEAVDDAVGDLRDHNDAMVVGVRASVKAALDAFDPREIERKLDRRGLIDVLPMLRDARLWVKFVENYDDFAVEAREDIRRVIGKELDSLYSPKDSGGARNTLKL